ncbi:MAG: Stk1 family PASTA domain-containing Ser/Thr kinase [Clostridiales bacterium]|nr:Stk1 family PASTA domain-containing Ser/Thr kinase [Clostridiales bacterium]
MIQPGTVLNNRFRIEELIGSGGMSLIFRGIDMKKHRTVAIKMLREQFTGDPVFIARFRREGQAVAGLSHPNIVKIYSVCQDKDVYYLVLELVEGNDLKQILHSRAKPFEPREIYAIVAQVCDAVNYAHHKSIIHRDIKPHNIIMSPDGLVKVTDFGIARAASEATVTHTGSIMGSVHYLSPEQARGELADHRSDIYSLGVLLYEIATGKLPFEGESPISVALQKIQQDPVPPGKANSAAAVPEALEQVILKAMNRSPQRRYQSALELKDDLREACFNNRLLYIDEPEIDKLEDTLDRKELTGLLGTNGRGGLTQETGQEELMGNTASKSNAGAATKTKTWRARLVKLVLGVILFCGIAVGGLALGRAISNWFYSPPEEIEAPSVVGRTEEAAVQILEDLGLIGSILENRVARDNIASGSVAIQDPAAFTPVRPGSTIHLTLSRGPATYPAPSLLDETQQSALILLHNLGLDIGNVETINDSETPEGFIMGQTPEAGTPLLPGDTVDIIVSLGPVVKYVTVQSFVGMPVADAQAAARGIGVEFGYTSYEMSWSYPKDTIINQDPAGSTQAPEGTPINIVVSLGPGPD